MDQRVDVRRLRLGLGDKLLMRHQLLAERVDRRVQLADADIERGETAAREENIEAAQLVAQLAILLRFARLALERADLAFDLADHVGETQQIRFGLIDLAQRFFAVSLELGDAGGLLENRAAVLWFGGEDGVDLPLGHHRIRGGADAGAHEKPMDIFEAAEIFVDEVLSLARAENTAGDGDLIKLGVEQTFTVSKGDRDLCHTQRLTAVGPVEHHIRHLGTTQRGRPLLAQHPANRIGNIAFAAAVRPHNCDHAGLELQAGLVRKTLKAGDFDLF